MKLCTSRTKRFKSSVPEGGELAWEGLRAKGSFLFSYSCMFKCLVLISPAINSWVICLIFMFYVAFWLVLSFRISYKVSMTLSLLLLLLHPPRFPFPPILCPPHLGQFLLSKYFSMCTLPFEHGWLIRSTLLEKLTLPLSAASSCNSSSARRRTSGILFGLVSGQCHS